LFTPVDGCFFKLIVPPNVPFLSIDKVSHFSYENEFLLPPGFTFRIIRKESYFNTYLQVNQVKYTGVMHNYHSYYNILTAFKPGDDANFKPPQSPQSPSAQMLAVNASTLKQSHAVIRKLINILNRQSLLPLPCLNSEVYDSKNGKCVDFRSKQGKLILHEQLILLIENISPQQNQFNYLTELSNIKRLISLPNSDDSMIDQLIDQYLSKYMSRLSEEN
jgi:hypothetical protein